MYILFVKVNFFISVICSLRGNIDAADVRPNFLFLVVDDMRPELGCYGASHMHTPNIDRLAASSGSVLFERAYVQQAICGPTRTSFLTGRRPDTTKTWDLFTYWRTSGGNFTTLPQMLKEAGWYTVGAGKVFHPSGDARAVGHLDDVPYSWSGPYFHAHDGGITNLSSCAWAVPADIANDTDLQDGKLAMWGVKTLQELSKRSDPWFMALGLHRPHLPWTAPAKYFSYYDVNQTLADNRTHTKDWGPAQKYAWDPQSGPRHCAPVKDMQLSEMALLPDPVAQAFRRAYFASVSFTDANLGRVLDELDRTGMSNSTVVILLGDHGWQLGDLGEFGKKTNFEKATRTPLIIRDPRTPKVAVKSRALVELVDLMPTIADLAGLTPPPLCPVDSHNVQLCTEGVSLLPLLTHSEPHVFKPAVFMQYAACMHDEPAAACPSGKTWHDACKKSTEPSIMGYVIRTSQYRYVEWVRFNQTGFPPTPLWNEILGRELYDHGTDKTDTNAAEAINLVNTEASKDIVAELSDQLHAGWRNAIIEIAPTLSSMN